MHIPHTRIPVYRALTIVGDVLRIDRVGMAHVPFESDTTLGPGIEVVFELILPAPGDRS